MAVGGGNITLRQIITEWSNGIGGTQSLSSFRRNTSSETAFCPNNYNTITTLPASGNLSASSFRNTEAEASASTILNGWFSPQINYFNRTGFRGGNSIPPINDFNGGTYNRFNGSWTTSYAFDQGGSPSFHRAYSKKSTVLQWVIGAQSAITDGSTQTDYTLHQAYNFREQNFRVAWKNQLHRQTTAGYVSYNRLGNNSGAWDGQYVLPGLWTVTQWFQQPFTTATPPTGDLSFTIAIPAGQIMFFTSYNASYDGNMIAPHYPPTLDTGVFSTASCHWWYNCAVHQVFYNSSTSSRNIRWPNVWQETPVKGGGSVDLSGMFAGNDSARGHQAFFLSRTY